MLFVAMPSHSFSKKLTCAHASSTYTARDFFDSSAESNVSSLILENLVTPSYEEPHWPQESVATHLLNQKDLNVRINQRQIRASCFNTEAVELNAKELNALISVRNIQIFKITSLCRIICSTKEILMACLYH